MQTTLKTAPSAPTEEAATHETVIDFRPHLSEREKQEVMDSLDSFVIEGRGYLAQNPGKESVILFSFPKTAKAPFTPGKANALITVNRNFTAAESTGRLTTDTGIRKPMPQDFFR